MTPEELAHQMQQLVDGTHPLSEWKWDDDPQTGHSEADYLMVSVLRELGFNEAMDIYESCKRWYS